MADDSRSHPDPLAPIEPTRQISQQPSAGSGGAAKDFGRYRIMAELGRGGMGVVYKAHDSQLKRLVAIKVLNPEESMNPESTERFAREAEAMARLRHPNIVQIHDIGSIERRHYFTMDLIEGPSLKELLENPPPMQSLVAILAKIGDAVHYAHRQGIVHRDLKPANVMMDANGEPYVMDFGLAKISRASKKLSKSGMILGTLQYMPSEQAAGRVSAVDERSDVYALGAILYEILAGCPPFGGGTSYNVLYRILHEEPTPPRKIKPRAPEDLESVCLKCLEKEKRLRYQSASEFVDDLSRFSRNEPVGARHIGFFGRLRRKAKRNRSVMALAIVSCAAIFAGFLWSFLAWREAEKARIATADAKRKVEEALASEKRIGEELAAKTRRLEEEEESLRKVNADLAEEKRRSDKALYRMSIVLANQYLDEREFAKAEVCLANAPIEGDPAGRRPWEWRWLHGRLPEVRRFEQGSPAWCCAFSADGKRLAVGSDSLQIRDMQTEEKIQRLEVKSGHGSVLSCAFSPDGRKLLSTHRSGRVSIWDLSDGSETVLQKSGGSGVEACAFSPDGLRAASGGGESNCALLIWDVASGRNLCDVERHARSVTACRFTPDGKFAVSASPDKSIHVWHSDGRHSRKFADESVLPEEDVFTAMDISPDGEQLVSGSRNGMLRLHKFSDAKFIARIAAHTSAVTSCAFSPDGRTVLSSGEDMRLHFWNLADRTGSSFAAHTHPVRDCAFSPDGRSVATVGEDGTAALWSMAPRRENPETLRCGTKLYRCAASLDGSRIAVAGSMAFRIADTHAGNEFRDFVHGTLCQLHACAFSPDGRKAVSAGNDSSIVFWDVETGKQLLVLKGHSRNVRTCSFSPDGRRLASGGTDRTLRVWDLESGRLHFAFEEQKAEVLDCAFSPDGRWIASALNDQEENLKIWGIEGRSLAKVLNGHVGAATSCVYSPDGKSLVTGGLDNSVRIWDLETGACRILRGHGHNVSDVDVSPDGARIVSASLDMTLRIWNPIDGEEMLVLEGHESHVVSCSFADRGKTIVSGESSGAIKIWQCP